MLVTVRLLRAITLDFNDYKKDDLLEVSEGIARTWMGQRSKDFPAGWCEIVVFPPVPPEPPPLVDPWEADPAPLELVDDTEPAEDAGDEPQPETGPEYTPGKRHRHKKAKEGDVNG